MKTIKPKKDTALDDYVDTIITLAREREAIFSRIGEIEKKKEYFYNRIRQLLKDSGELTKETENNIIGIDVRTGCINIKDWA